MIQCSSRLSCSRRGAPAHLVALFLTIALFLTLMALPSRAAEPPKIVVLGDSLVAGHGLPANQAFPPVLQTMLAEKGIKVELVNAGVSGDTAAAGLARLDWSVADGTQGVILELGANDMLRGMDPAVTKATLDTIITRLKARNIPVLLVGMQAAPNLGADYVARFNAIYPDLAKAHGVALYPFFLDGVAGNPSLNLPDGLHPTAEGVRRIATAIVPTVAQFISSLPQR
ncbi:multifunctional acyl-CoA thioesterase I and protease I and lysophospholipase L1 [Chelatococcus asaccharovorans]|nr:multifunctional acyl-CoA thioesterase I and protease I and lysophospholipase L1 [Chelatococcus asaccharovorans]CAH1684843.1 multifunctional acyl-CoA thioesterase I and protease I and lysophospholipase L1 [Chelatococcus asaccharovorans]